MKKTLFALFTLTISFQVYSQTSQQYFEDLSNNFTELEMQTQMISNNFSQLEYHSSMNYDSHTALGQPNLAANWNDIKYTFSSLYFNFFMLRENFNSTKIIFNDFGLLFGSFDGSYGSLVGLPSLFDGNFSSLSGTPTTLAGYGITDGFSGNYSDLSGKPTLRDLSSSSPVVFGSLDAFGGTFSNRATIDVIADSNGDLITGYKNGASGDRFNVKLDTTDENVIVSSGGGFGLKLRSESGQMIFEGMDMFDPVLFSFNGVASFNGEATFEENITLSSDKKVFFGASSFIEGATSGTKIILNADDDILFRPGNVTKVTFDPRGDVTIAGDLNINSDARLKANIISLGGTLSKLLQIDGKSYTMKKDVDEKQKIGLLAQDIEKVFPELVSEREGIKSVNYQGLVPVLINALKEQDEKMKVQQLQIDELKTLLQKIIK